MLLVLINARIASKNQALLIIAMLSHISLYSMEGPGDSVGCDYKSYEARRNIKADATLMARTFTEVHYVAWSDVFAVAQNFPEIREIMVTYLYTMDLCRCSPVNHL